MKRLIQNARILTMDADMRILDPGWILLENDTIRDLGEMPGDPAALPQAGLCCRVLSTRTATSP